MKITVLFFSFILSVLIMNAQEICNNGIDDDGDGLVDCFDQECDGSADCNGFFFPVDPADTGCTHTPALNGMSIQWNNPNYSWMEQFPFVAGDIDNDGMPEVIINNAGGPVVLNGTDGTFESTLSFFGSNKMAFADVDDDGYAEIFATLNGGSVECRTYDDVHVWTANNLTDSIPDDGFINIADFNMDGNPEVYMGRTILDAQTGAKIYVAHEPILQYFNYSIAADVLEYNAATCPDCDGLELVYRNEVYSVDIPGKSITLRATAPGGRPIGKAGVVDFDQDGKLDIVVAAPWVSTNPGPNSLYVWEPRTGTIVDGFSCRMKDLADYGGGIPNVANFDDDPDLEIGVSTKGWYTVWDHDMSLLWRHHIEDQSSGLISGTIYDLNCDGRVEVILRDEDSLYIFDGLTGNTIANDSCESTTWDEHPLIMDVDDDGAAEIVCGCKGNGKPSQMRVYESSGEPWSNARKMWNQMIYYAVHINDDLSVPIEQQNHGHPDVFGYNSFYCQPPYRCKTLTAELSKDNDPFCNNGCDGGATVTADGAAPYTYTWTNGETTTSVSNLCADSTHYVTVEDDNGCTAEVSVFMNNPVNIIIDSTSTAIPPSGEIHVYASHESDFSGVLGLYTFDSDDSAATTMTKAAITPLYYSNIISSVSGGEYWSYDWHASGAYDNNEYFGFTVYVTDSDYDIMFTSTNILSFYINNKSAFTPDLKVEYSIDNNPFVFLNEVIAYTTTSTKYSFNLPVITADDSIRFRFHARDMGSTSFIYRAELDSILLTGAVKMPLQYDIGSGQQDNGSFTGLDTGLYFVTITDANGCSELLPFDLTPPLPVKIIIFKGWKEGSANILQWTTESEQNNDYFIIERSINAADFNVTGRIKGSGTVNAFQYYTFIDESPEYGENYYRLKQVDFNGNFEYSSIIAIEKTENELREFSISGLYPNPAGDELKIIIHTNKDIEKVSISIHDIYGRKLISNKEKLNSGENIIRFDLEYLSAGIYYLSISDSENTGFKRFVKN